jgi:hypothetical protein
LRHLSLRSISLSLSLSHLGRGRVGQQRDAQQVAPLVLEVHLSLSLSLSLTLGVGGLGSSAMRSRLRHLSLRSTAERAAMAGYPSFLMSAHLPPPQTATPSTSASASCCDHGLWCLHRRSALVEPFLECLRLFSPSWRRERPYPNQSYLGRPGEAVVLPVLTGTGGARHLCRRNGSPCLQLAC